MKNLEELPIPERVIQAEQKAELARIWLADRRQIVTLSDRLWDDPGAWGLMLVDLARHVASAYEAIGYDHQATLKDIRRAFDAEWSSPTD